MHAFFSTRDVDHDMQTGAPESTGDTLDRIRGDVDYDMQTGAPESTGDTLDRIRGDVDRDLWGNLEDHVQTHTNISPAVTVADTTALANQDNTHHTEIKEIPCGTSQRPDMNYFQVRWCDTSKKNEV